MRLPTRDRSTPLDPQLTSMISLSFLMLVFFLWTSSFDEPEFDMATALSITPIGETGELSDVAPVLFDEIVIHVVQPLGKQQELRINESVVGNLVDLKTRLVAIAAIGAQPSVIVDPDPATSMESAIAVYDLARVAGFDRVFFKVSP